MGIESPIGGNAHTNDPELAKKFPQVRIDSSGVVHTVENTTAAAEEHQQELADA